MPCIVAAFGKYGEDFESFFLDETKDDDYLVREMRIVMGIEYPELKEHVHYIIYFAELPDNGSFEWDEDSALDYLHQARVIDYKAGNYPVLQDEGELV